MFMGLAPEYWRAHVWRMTTKTAAVYAKLDAPLNIAFALGALGGLRPGEAFALRWDRVDIDRRRIHLQESVTGRLKDKDSRIVPILDPLLPILKAWRDRTGGGRLLAPPLRVDGRKMDKGTWSERLRVALADLKIKRKGLGWYECTRHTFASQWVMHGGSIEKLKEILGHYSVIITERYAHLRPDLFRDEDLSTLPEISQQLASGQNVVGIRFRNRRTNAGAAL